LQSKSTDGRTDVQTHRQTGRYGKLVQ